MHPFFQDLGNTVLERWKELNFSQEAFPQVAKDALEENPPAEHVDVPELVRDFLLDDRQPFQTQSGFGQPEIVAYDNPRFYIQILFWLDGTTDIHQHMFSGAFHVLAGSSLHACFQFEDATSITAHLRTGTLKRTHAELLEAGTTVEITSGRDFIHSLFHLETPSITVVIRTHTDPGTGPQFTYLPPHLAVDPLHSDTLTNRRKQLLDLLECIGDPGYTEIVVEMLESLDFERGFFILQNCVTHLHTLGTWREVWSVFGAKHGQLANYVAPTISSILQRDALVALRSRVDEPDHRLFLALLLNIPERNEIHSMIEARFGEDPSRLIKLWSEEITTLHEDAAWVLETYYSELIS
jgi:hypothetical protein